MNTRHTLFTITTTISLALFAADAFAADAPKSQSAAPMKCMAGKEMQCDMAMQMGGMHDRMAQMQTIMESCAKGEKHCEKGAMTAAMHDMQSHMDQMMKNMMAMPDDQKDQSVPTKPAQPDDHAQHHPETKTPAPK